MRDYQIKIEPFEFVALLELKLDQKVNNHAKASIIMRIKDQYKEQYATILAKEMWVKITAVGEQEVSDSSINTVLFYGLVTDFSFCMNGYETIFNLELTSGTVLMDLKPHFRVFQNEESYCIDICKKVAEEYVDSRVTITEGEEDQTGGVIIQYNETDWEFLKRLAGRTSRYLVPNVIRKGTKFSIGLPEGKKKTIQTDKLQVKLDMKEFMEKSHNGMRDLQISNMLEITVEEREIFELGDILPYQGKDYFVYRILTNYNGEECIHTYYLKTKEALKVLPRLNHSLTGFSCHAVITNIKKDKVQVNILEDEWKGQDGVKWFLYATVYSSSDGTGWYCMPEVGDSVRLSVPEKEEDSFIISAVHKETDSSRQNPDYKSFKTKYGKEILFTPDSLLMTNNNGMMLEMHDSEGITITSDKDIVIQAEENLTVASGAASLLIAANDKVQVKQGGTTMTLEGDITFTGGEFRIQ